MLKLKNINKNIILKIVLSTFVAFEYFRLYKITFFEVNSLTGNPQLKRINIIYNIKKTLTNNLKYSLNI